MVFLLFIIETGVVTLQVQRARNFQWEHYRTKPRKLFVVTSLGWGDKPLHKTEASYQSDLPVWNSSFDFVCYEKTSAVIVMKIVEKANTDNPVIYGHLSIALNELIAAQDDKREWWPLSGCPDGELRLIAEWSPLEMSRESIYTG